MARTWATDWVVPSLAMPDHCAVLYQSLPAAVTSVPSLTGTNWEAIMDMLTTKAPTETPVQSFEETPEGRARVLYLSVISRGPRTPPSTRPRS